jgi:hypothetical protein
MAGTDADRGLAPLPPAAPADREVPRSRSRRDRRVPHGRQSDRLTMTEGGDATSGRTDPRHMAVLAGFFESPPGRALLREVLERIAAEETAERRALAAGRPSPLPRGRPP